MTDLSKLTDEKLLELPWSQGPHDQWFAEGRRRLADLRASLDQAQIEREDAVQGQRRLLNRVSRLIGSLDESKDLLAAAEAERDRLVAVVDAAEKALDYAPWLDANERWDSAISALRAAVNAAKEEGHNELENY